MALRVILSAKSFLFLHAFSFFIVSTHQPFHVPCKKNNSLTAVLDLHKVVTARKLLPKQKKRIFQLKEKRSRDSQNRVLANQETTKLMQLAQNHGFVR